MKSPLPLLVFASLSASLSLGGCATSPSIGASGAKTVATGSAGGANAVGANDKLERCDKSLGTLAIVEESNQPWLHQFTAEYRMQSTVPLLSPPNPITILKT